MHRVGWVPSVWRDYTKCIALIIGTGNGDRLFLKMWGGGGGGGSSGFLNKKPGK